MSDEQLSDRLARVERHHERLDQRVDDLDTRVSAMGHVITSTAVLSEQVSTLRDTFAQHTRDFRSYKDRQDERDEATDRERRITTRWAIGLTITILVAILTTGAVVLSTALHL